MSNILKFSTGNNQRDNENFYGSSLNLSSDIGLEDPDKLRESLRELLPDFYSVFPDIKRYINKLILKDTPTKTNYTKNPSVNVKYIAKKLGLKIILFSFEDFFNILKKHNIDIKSIQNFNHNFMIPKHAFLAYKEAIIFVNKNDSIEERLFSIAHEIFHFVFLKDQNNMDIITDKKRIWTAQLEKKFNIKSLKENNQSDNDSLASRFHFAARDNKEARKKFMSVLRNIHLEEDMFIAIIYDTLIKDMSDMVEDEIADYFAANLLVPVERFILWDDKPEEEIAKAFRTVERCIQKRKLEIKNELRIMKPKNLSSGVSLEKVAL
jgi:Zn-dependent peptidase ImmA (M78 family)